MKHTFTIVAFLFACLLSVRGQNTRWQASLEPQKVFIENKTQFDGRNELPAYDVLFATEDGPVQYVFSKNGLTIRLEKRERAEPGEREEREEGMSHAELEAQERKVVLNTDVVQMLWKNSNSGVEVIGVDQAEAGYYYKGQHGSIAAKAFRKIKYTNLYPGIDAEYEFHPQTGIKYSFIIHPGADASMIRMTYSDVSRVSFDANRNATFPTLFGDIIDHAPSSFYADSRATIPSRFLRKGRTISFELGDYDRHQTIVIDPWTVTPAMGNSNKVFNIEADSLGNAYIYGGDSPYKLQKYNTTGALQWTFTNGWDSASYWCGTLIVDRPGNAYITAGSTAEITKVNASGSQVWTHSGGIFDEYWSMAFNCDETELMVGGTRLTGIPIINGSGRAYNINLSDGSVINSIKVSNAIPAFIINDPNEIRSVCASPNGNYYFLTLDTIGSLAPALSGINWERQSGYRFGYGSPNYGFTPQGQSIIRASATHIYTANGDSIVMRDINTGIVVGAAAIPGGGHATTFLVPGTLPKNGGIALDSCGNVFAGSQNNVTMYDASLNFISSTPTPSAVYDVAIGADGDVLASGNGFAVALAIPACAQIHLDCNTTVAPVALFSAPNTICPGTCTDFTNLSTNATSFQWYFPGATPAVSSDTDPASICYNAPGTYDVTLVATSPTGTDSVTLANYITVYAYPPPQGIIQSGDTLFANQGSTSYQWYQDGMLIPGATDYYLPITQGGNYNVVATDANGCEVEAAIFDVIAAAGSVSPSLPRLELIPNPVIDRLNVSASGFPKGNLSIRIYNALGELIIERSTVKHDATVDFQSLPAGTYWVEVSSAQKQLRSKIIKQ